MKTLIATLMLTAPLLTLSSPAVAQSASKAKPAAAKKAPAKPAAKSSANSRAKPTATRGKAAAAAAGAAAVAAAPAVLAAEDLAVAERVYKGRIPCEMGAYVNVNPDPAHPGYFHVDGKGFKYHMAPVATTTGTIRLEDKAAGAVWLQIANKSMLMNQKIGQRLADECMAPEQQQVADAIRRTPPPALLDTK